MSDTMNTSEMEQKACALLAMYDSLHETYRIPKGPFSSLLFIHLKKTDRLEFVSDRLIKFFGQDTMMLADMSFRDAHEQDGALWGECNLLFELLCSLNPKVEELYFMHHIYNGAAIADFNELFIDQNYPTLVEVALAHDLKAAPPSFDAFFQPSALTSLLLSLLHLHEGASLYDPFAKLCGAGTMVTNVQYSAQEVVPTLWAVAMIRTEAYGLPGDQRNEDAFSNWNPNGTKFDGILLNLTVRKVTDKTPEVAFPSRDHSSIAIQCALGSLAKKGRVAALVPERLLYSNSEVGLRRYLVEKNLLDTVVSLPSGMFRPHAGIKTSIMVLQAGRRASAPVRLLDAEPFSKPVKGRGVQLDVEQVLALLQRDSEPVLLVPASRILEDDTVSLAVSRFLVSTEAEQMLLEFGDQHICELSNVLYDDLRRPDQGLRYPRIREAQLSNEILELYISAKHGLKDENRRSLYGLYLNQPALLLARMGFELKPTLFDTIAGPAVIQPSVYAFRVDEQKVLPEYLAMELRSELVTRQVQGFRRGGSIASISRKDLLRLRVRLPGLPEQRRIVRERKEAILLAKREELARQEKQHGLTTQEWQILGAVEHSFRPVLAMVEQPMEKIRTTSAALSNEARDGVIAALEMMNGGLDRMRSLFVLINAVVRSDKQSLRPVPMDLRRLFRNEVLGLGPQLKGIRVFFQCEDDLETEDGVVARVDPQQFALLVQNLFTNMAKHARKPEQEDLIIVVRVATSIEPGRTWLVITIENNGQPFPEGFDHEKLVAFGTRADMNKGNGIGGYLMDRIIANHGGRFRSGNVPIEADNARMAFSREQRLDESHGAPMDRETASANMAVFFTIELPLDHSEDHG